MSRTVPLRYRPWLLASLVLCTLAPDASLAQGYPSRPLRWIIPYPTGGTSDFLARLIGQQLAEALGQSVVIDNRGGANGNIGTEMAARSVPDGHTLLLVASTFTMNPWVYPKLPFDSARDFAAVTTILWQPYLLSVHPSLPAASVKELIDMARAKPGAIEYSSGGSGNATHIAAERFASMAGIKLTHVPYRGVGPAIVALLGGEVKLMFASSVAVQPHLKAGKIKVLAVTGVKRIASMPEVPTVAEAGVPKFEEGNWQMVLVPAATARPIVAKLNQEIVRILKSAEITRQIALTGSDVIANTPAQSDALVQADLKKYAAVIKTLGIRLD
ncbi:MAG: tripartite tricarboxylate transporter substrate binding protein [Burkholderiales bacterium]|nr:tripartite tricarboxylate transporter substrate binding protein [Burkholderiales bacterium]